MSVAFHHLRVAIEQNLKLQSRLDKAVYENKKLHEEVAALKEKLADRELFDIICAEEIPEQLYYNIEGLFHQAKKD